MQYAEVELWGGEISITIEVIREGTINCAVQAGWWAVLDDLFPGLPPCLSH